MSTRNFGYDSHGRISEPVDAPSSSHMPDTTNWAAIPSQTSAGDRTSSDLPKHHGRARDRRYSEPLINLSGRRNGQTYISPRIGETSEPGGTRRNSQESVNPRDGRLGPRSHSRRPSGGTDPPENSVSQPISVPPESAGTATGSQSTATRQRNPSYTETTALDQIQTPPRAVVRAGSISRTVSDHRTHRPTPPVTTNTTIPLVQVATTLTTTQSTSPPVPRKISDATTIRCPHDASSNHHTDLESTLVATNSISPSARRGLATAAPIEERDSQRPSIDITPASSSDLAISPVQAPGLAKESRIPQSAPAFDRHGGTELERQMDMEKVEPNRSLRELFRRWRFQIFVVLTILVLAFVAVLVPSIYSIVGG